MGSDPRIQRQAAIWAEQLQSEPSFTTADIEELKNHLIDLAEDLHASGLNADEAIRVAAFRLEAGPGLVEEYHEINSPVIQLRKTIFVLSGILVFFFFYFLLFFSSRVLYLALLEGGVDKYEGIYWLRYYHITYLLVFVMAITCLWFTGSGLPARLDKVRPTPRQAIGLFVCVLLLAGGNDLLTKTIKAAVDSPQIYYQLIIYDDRFGNLFGFIIILGFIFLYKKHYSRAGSSRDHVDETPIPTNGSHELTAPDSSPDTGTPDPVLQDSIPGMQDEQVLLSSEEVAIVSKIRSGKQEWPAHTGSRSGESPMEYILLSLSGVLLYFLLYYFLFASGRALFAILYYIDQDVVLNIRRTWSYFLAFQGIIVLYTAALWFLDKNLVGRLKNLRIKPSHTSWLLAVTVMLGIIDRMFYPVGHRIIVRENSELYKLYAKIFMATDYTLPFLLSACFLVLFYKYYQDNVRIGA